MALDAVARAVRIAGHPDRPCRSALYLTSVSTKCVTVEAMRAGEDGSSCELCGCRLRRRR